MRFVPAGASRRFPDVPITMSPMYAARSSGYACAMERRQITDNRGKRFCVVMDEPVSGKFICRILRHNHTVGHLVVSSLYSTWHIDGLLIGESPDEHRTGLLRFFRRQGSARYRGHGLGTKVLGLLVAEARSRGIRQITGEVVPENPEDAEPLKRFYERIGFGIGEKPAHADERAVASIVLNVDTGADDDPASCGS